jgi:hypothetical protein
MTAVCAYCGRGGGHLVEYGVTTDGREVGSVILHDYCAPPWKRARDLGMSTPIATGASPPPPPPQPKGHDAFAGAAKSPKLKSRDINDVLRERGRDEVRRMADAAKPAAPPRNSGPTDHKSRGRQLVLERLSQVTPTAVSWLWPDRIPRKSVYRPTYVGKTLVAIDIAARITMAAQWPDGSGRAPRGSLVFVTAEDGIADTIRTRAEAAGANLNRFHYLKSVIDKDGRPGVFSLQEDLARLKEVIGTIGDVAMIVIDPVTAYLGAGKLDTHKTADVRAVLSPLAEFVDEQNLTVLGITHPPKSVGGNAINAATGSLAFVAAARAAYLFSRDKENGRTLMPPIKNNLGPLKDGLAFRINQRIVAGNIVAPHLDWDQEPVTVTANDVLAAEAERASGDRSALREAMDFLRTELLVGEVETTIVEEQARRAGIAPRTLKRARAELGVKTRREGFGVAGKFFLSLPIEGQEPP